MSDKKKLQEMYRRTVLEHSRHPRNFRRLDAPDRTAEGFNPLCGDKITVYLDLGQESIRTIAFEGTGCAISLASASMMMEAIEGRPLSEAGEIVQRAQAMFRSDAESPAQSDIEGLQALGGVRAYPSRIKCATLPWKTLQAALNGTTGAGRISTE
jgi:nitrogen fixation NifU-like protein